MSDIDFDELDRAVASVLSGEAKAAAPAAAVAAAPAQPASAPTLTPAPTPKPAESEVTPVAVNVIKPAPVAPTPTPNPTPAPATAVTKPVAAPAQALHAQPVKPVQRGRFMDFALPSKPAAPALVIQPSIPAPGTGSAFVSDVVAPAPTSSVPVTPTPTSAAPVTTPEAPKTEPADFFAADAPDDSNPHKSPELTPSPFIPDAKVEKRPLGGFAAGTAGAGFNSAGLPVGEELHDKLVAVESEDNIVRTAESPIPQTPVVEPKPVEAPKPVPVAATPAPVVTETPVPAPAVVAPKKDEPKPEHHLALFDHHDRAAKSRLDKPPKYGKGTLIWITVAIAVMLIGFGVGATLYFVVLR